MADERAVEKLAERVTATHGVVDVLVNNAGVGLGGAFLDTTTAEWKRVLDVNLWGVIHGCLHFGRRMAERGQGGHIVNVASAAAFQPSRALPAYGASKAAVLMLSESLRAELAERDIGVTAVCPGFVTTGITSTARFARARTRRRSGAGGGRRRGCTGCATIRRRRSPPRCCGRWCATRRSCRSPRRRGRRTWWRGGCRGWRGGSRG